MPGTAVAVLLKIYANCIYGQADATKGRVTGDQDTQPGSLFDPESAHAAQDATGI